MEIVDNNDMKIIRNKITSSFFKRCRNNIQNDAINNCLGLVIRKEDEDFIRKELRRIGDYEFQSPKASWPSLYIDTDEFIKTPYNANIHLDRITDDQFEYSYDEMPANVLFNLEEVKKDPNRELNDYLVLRAFDKPYKSVVLKQNGEYWMTDNPVEAATINPSVNKAYGRVLAFGLGIGYFPYMCLLKDEVEDVSVVELNPAVIRMFKEHLLPQFPRNDKLKIIEGDALTYFNKDFLKDYDFVFVDVWMNPNDGFPMIERMLEEYYPPFDKVDFWIEDSCFEVVTSLILQYFDCLSLNRKLKVAKKHQRLLMKIEKYFAGLDIVVDDPIILKELMYDRETLRKIVSTRI